MPFLGKTPAQGFVNSVTKDDFTPNGTTTAFTLSKSPATVNELEVYVGNVRQEPTDAYSVSGTTLTMSAAPANGLNFYVVFKGLEENSVVPADGTITNEKLGLGQSLQLPSGTTAQRPTPVTGMLRNNTTSGYVEVYNGTSWETVGDQALQWELQYVVVAAGGGGGGGGAGGEGGGGGAGGYRTNVTGQASGGGASAESVIFGNQSQYQTLTVTVAAVVVMTAPPASKEENLKTLKIQLLNKCHLLVAVVAVQVLVSYSKELMVVLVVETDSETAQ